jgi:hypothetical protein
LTGGVAASHDITSVSTYGIQNPEKLTADSASSSGSTPPLKDNNRNNVYNKNNGKPKIDSTPLGSVFYIFMFIVILAVGYIIWYLSVMTGTSISSRSSNSTRDFRYYKSPADDK